MGSSASKAAQKAPRKFPTRPPGAAASMPSRSIPPQHATPKASYKKDDVRADPINPESDVSAAFSNRLKQMGVAQPNPTFSPSSTANPGPDLPQEMPESAYPSATNNTTLSVLEARQRLQDKADDEFDHMGRSSDKGREFLDVATIRDTLSLRARGIDPAAIESRLRLKTGVVKRLGPPGMVAALGTD